MTTKVPKHPISARFWANLPESSRAWLAGFDIGARDVGDEPLPCDAAAPADSTSARARQLRQLGGDDQLNRADRRRAAALEREARRRDERERERVRLETERQARFRASKAALRHMTPAERRLHLATRNAERDRARLERQRDRMAKRYPNEEPPELANCPRSVLIMARDCLADPSGGALKVWFGRQRNKVAVGLIRIAALVPGRDGRTRYTWADSRARAIAALGLVLLELSTPTVRKGRWSRLVRGYPRSLLCKLLANPYDRDRVPCANTLGGVHVPGATLESGQVGYLRALELSGFLSRQQLPAHQVDNFERWRVPKGTGQVETHASNRYWIVTDTATAPLSDDMKRRLMDAHNQGMRAHREQPRRRARTHHELELDALELAQPARAAPS